MAGSGEILIVVIMIIALAVVLPLLLDVELPPSFSICSVFVGALNLTCTEPEGNVTFIGINPISIVADNSQNTITWSVGFNASNATHQNVGGGAEVFKNETLGNVHLRTLIAGSGALSIVQNDETIEFNFGQGGGGPLQNIQNGSGNNLFNSSNQGNTVTFVGQGVTIDNSSSVVFKVNITGVQPINVTKSNFEIFQVELDKCSILSPPNQFDNKFLLFNHTSGFWECVDGDDFSKGSVFNNQALFLPHLCAGTASDPIIPFSNYSVRAVEMDKPKDCNYVFPAPKSNPENAQVQMWWFKDTAAAGTVCFETSIFAIQIGDDVDGTFTNKLKECETFGAGGVDELRFTQMNYTSLTGTGIPANETADMIVIKIDRPNEAPDDYLDPAWIMMARVIWQS